MGKTASTSAIIRPSKRIIYDTTEAIVSFLSENVDTCVDEFLEEWARVSKMVVIAREVAQMAKDQGWNGVRLLSFDLQTVEFAYAGDFTVSITCTDQLSPTDRSFDLRFSRLRSHDDRSHSDRFNPHDDAEPFMRNILQHGHGRLAPSLHRLVALLRATLPIVIELEEIQRESETDLRGGSVDTFAKAAGWFRVLYGDLRCVFLFTLGGHRRFDMNNRHALDFRLMKGQRVCILDGSHSLFGPGADPATSSPKKHATVLPSVPDVNDKLGLQPIPHFQEVVLDAVREVTSSESGRLELGKIAPVDVGVVCAASAVRAVGQAIHRRVFQQSVM
jgi:mediator of RNA polymerase II transcription subunit 14